MRKIFTLIALSFLTASAALAQTGTRITGLVKDAQSKPLASATVSLLRAADSSLVKLAVSGKTGIYEFTGIPQGQYLLSVTSVGFDKRYSQVIDVNSAEVSVPDLALAEAAKDMGAVVVQAKRPFVETKLDKTIVNVEASPTNAGATALEVLEKSPGVTVNSDGAISLRGKQGVIVMIDGKPTYLSATDLANLLKNMPASSLDQIEIMTNPSSKYDASGNSGIINIRTKKGKSDGFNGSIMVGATSSIYKPGDAWYFLPKSQNSFNFNYRKNKINIFGNYNPNMFRGRNTQLLNRKFFDENGALSGTLDQQVGFKFRSDNHTLKLGMDWFADKKNTFGIVASGFSAHGQPAPHTVAESFDADGNLESRMISDAKNDFYLRNFTGNVNWRHVFDSSNHELTADVDFVKYDNLTEMLLTTLPFKHTGEAGAPLYLRGNLPSDISIFSVKSDYVKPYKNGRFEAGLKTSFVTIDNVVDYQNRIGDKWLSDPRSNHFIYEENINAAYLNGNRQWGKWTLQGGLRLEHTIAKGRQITINESFERNKPSLFPSAFASYEVNKNHKLTASYSRRITRPNYQNLNPFVFFLDSLTYMKGNPNLRPQFTHNMELSHAFRNKFITTLAYNNTTDVISMMIQQNTAERKSFNTFANVAKLNSISLSVTAPFKVARWWNANLFATVFNNHYEGIYNNKPLDLSATSFTANMTNSFTLSKTWTGEISGFYRHKGVDQLSILEAFYQMSLAVQKQVIKGKGTVRLNVRDPFAWQKFTGYTRYDDIDMSFSNRPDIRSVTASFTYRFGKSNNSQPRRRASSSQEEQSRVGQGS